MIFRDVNEGPRRAAEVAAALDPSRGWVHQGALVTRLGDRVLLDASKGVLWWREAGGEQRHLLLPSEISTVALAGLMTGLANVLLLERVRQ